ncbi:hypothetical protein NSMM_600033 [Nitrosomonas mobilis]|uniref:Uncharacterized protein n=1 Tax=Nitrosomonas mobilis TaxID=51642 RepID=A0A1G5SHB1_9PROT|nr:hypothetical protein NSMM_600033 [Nitrosomonas mobilis]
MYHPIPFRRHQIVIIAVSSWVQKQNEPAINMELSIFYRHGLNSEVQRLTVI